MKHAAVGGDARHLGRQGQLVGDLALGVDGEHLGRVEAAHQFLLLGEQGLFAFGEVLAGVELLAELGGCAHASAHDTAREGGHAHAFAAVAGGIVADDILGDDVLGGLLEQAFLHAFAEGGLDALLHHGHGGGGDLAEKFFETGVEAALDLADGGLGGAHAFEQGGHAEGEFAGGTDGSRQGEGGGLLGGRGTFFLGVLPLALAHVATAGCHAGDGREAAGSEDGQE